MWVCQAPVKAMACQVEKHLQSSLETMNACSEQLLVATSTLLSNCSPDKHKEVACQVFTALNKEIPTTFPSTTDLRFTSQMHIDIKKSLSEAEEFMNEALMILSCEEMRAALHYERKAKHNILKKRISDKARSRGQRSGNTSVWRDSVQLARLDLQCNKQAKKGSLLNAKAHEYLNVLNHSKESPFTIPCHPDDNIVQQNRILLENFQENLTTQEDQSSEDSQP